MAYQTITDVIANPVKIQDLQISKTTQDSPAVSSSKTSFSELISYFKNEGKYSESENVQKSESTEKSENLPKNEEKVKSDDSAQKTEKGDSASKAEKSEKSEEKDGKKAENAENAVEKQAAAAKNASEKLSLAKTEPENDGKNSDVSEKSEKSGKKAKNISDKIAEQNFYDNFSENISAETETAAQVAANVNVQAKNLAVQDETNQKGGEDFSDATDDLKTGSDLNVALSKTDANDELSDFADLAAKNTDRKKTLTLDKEGKITVEDLRTQPETDENLAKKQELKSAPVKLTADNSATMTFELQNANADVLSLDNQTAAANGSNFQAMLNNQIQTNASEFVKAGNLVLKDNNQGTINLVLHPDDLGNVKIHLSLDGKSISGHITVATKEAMEVFKDNAETLREAFIKNGFDNASFDVAFNNGGNFNQNDFESQNNGTNLFGKNVYKNMVSPLDSELESIIQNVEDISNYSVNIIA